MVSEGILKGVDRRQLFLTEERDQLLRHTGRVGNARFPACKKCFIKLFKAKCRPHGPLNHC